MVQQQEKFDELTKQAELQKLAEIEAKDQQIRDLTSAAPVVSESGPPSEEILQALEDLKT